LNPDRCALGVDLGGTNVRAAVVREDGKLLGTTKLRHPRDDRRPEPVADSIRAVCDGALREAQCDPTSVAAVGVGVAGQIHAGTGVVAVGPNLGWRQVPFKALLQQRLRWPVLLLNDLTAAAWGEHFVGAAAGAVDSAAVFVGSGIGCGLILRGDLYEGTDGVAGELGHIKVVPNGRLCGCGEHGCLEAYCGGRNLSARVAEGLAAGRTSSLAAESSAPVSAGAIEREALAGDSFARELWEECARMLAVAIGNLVTLLNPSRVILGGGVFLACPELRRRVARDAVTLANASARSSVQVVDAALGDDAGVVGSALRALASVDPSAARGTA
jgi:glucokinase